MGENAEKKKRRLQRDIERGEEPKGVYLIVLPANPENLLEICPVEELKLPCYRDRCFQVVGLAIGMEEARRLVLRMVEDVYQKTGEIKASCFLRDEAFYQDHVRPEQKESAG